MHGRGLRAISLLCAATLALSLALAFFWAPDDADQGFLQKIFYIHVPLAIITLIGFVAAGAMAVAHLRTGDDRWDLRSYVAIHISLIFGVAVLLTGSIWARGSWGHWWVWSEPTLVSFLLVMLLYATYQPLRFAIEDPERQARYASVFAIVAGAFVPINFIMVRLANASVHPRTLGNVNGNLPARMQVAFYVSLLAVGLLWLTLWRYEMTAKHAAAQLRALRRLLGADGDLDEDAAPHRSAAPGLAGIGSAT
jgi:heme exporter protein C